MNLSHEKIAILAGGSSCEREVSLVSGRAVEEALGSLDIQTLMIDPDTEGRFVGVLKESGVTMVFLALHGTFGEDGSVQSILEKAGIPYTGSGPEASRLAFDKALSQALFLRHGLCVPRHHILSSLSESEAPFAFPLVVKPACAGSSVGVTLVHEKKNYADACKEAFRWSEHLLIEEFISGRELTV